MRLAALVTVLALVPAPAVAQATPVERIAELARRALEAPHASSVWAALADALPEMALSEAVSLDEPLEAARIADSLSAALGPVAGRVPEVMVARRSLLPEPAPLPGAAEAAVGERAPGGSAGEGPVDVFPTGAAVLFMVGAGTGALGWLRLRARRLPALPAPPPPARRPGRAWAARELGRGSGNVVDVARRTGMAREAVALALRLEGAGGGRAA